MKQKKSADSRPAHMREAPLKLISAAGEAFAKKGFHAASFREIAEQANLSFQLISYHFGSKAELWTTTVNQLQTPRREAMLKAAHDIQGKTGKATAQWIRGWMRTGFLFATEDPQLRQIFTQEFFANSGRYTTTILPILRENIALGKQAFQHAYESGVITAVSYVEALFLYRALLCATSCLPFEIELAMRTRASTSQFIEHQLDMLMRIFTKGRGLPKSHSLAAVKPKRIKPDSKTTDPIAKQQTRISLQTTRSVDRRTARGEKVRDRLLQAAINHFSANGFGAASVRDIAADAEAAFPLVNYHFGSKEKLWEATLTHLFDKRISRIRSLQFDPEHSRRPQIRTWIHNGIKDAYENFALRRIYTQEYFLGSDRYNLVLKPKIKELDSATSAVYSYLIKKQFVSHISVSEMTLLFRSIIAMNSLMPDEVAMLVDMSSLSDGIIEWQVELLTRLLTQGVDT